jgi:hypothetical protein
MGLNKVLKSSNPRSRARSYEIKVTLFLLKQVMSPTTTHVPGSFPGNENGTGNNNGSPNPETTLAGTPFIIPRN